MYDSRRHALAALAFAASILGTPAIAYANQTPPAFFAVFMGIPSMTVAWLSLRALESLGRREGLRRIALSLALPIALLVSFFVIITSIDVLREDFGPLHALVSSAFVWFAYRVCWRLISPKASRTKNERPTPS